MGVSFLLAADFSPKFRVGVTIPSSKIKVSKGRCAKSQWKSNQCRARTQKPEDLGYHVKKNQLDAQLILSIFRQPLHVSGISRPIVRRYNVGIQQLVLIILFRWLYNKYQLLYTYGCASWWWACPKYVEVDEIY